MLLGLPVLVGACSGETDSSSEPDRSPSAATTSDSETPSADTAQRALTSSRRCFNRKPTAVGTSADDQFRGRPGRDVILALGGDDTVSGLHAADRLCAGPGDDEVSDVNGYGVHVSLGPGHDRIEMVSLAMFHADSGNDTVLVTWRDVTSVSAHLGPGADRLDVREDPTRPPPRYGEVCVNFGKAVHPIHVDLSRGIATGQGRDRITGVRCVNGSPGRDHVVGTPGVDYIEDWRGPLHARTRAGDDFVNGSRDSDVVRLGPGKDTFMGYRGNDRGFGGSGPDTLEGGDGVEVLHGGAGDDKLSGGPFCYSLYRDPLRADGSPNRLYGGRGADHLVGDIGNDFLHGGPGTDRGFGQDDGFLDTLVSLERPFYCR